MDTVVIAYDAARGENRGSRPRSADPKALGLGDCIDCTLCVQVCPTGIDIRNGLQNECIACAACIDVCDDVMKKMGYPLGLIRYSSGNVMAENLSSKKMLIRLWRPRVLIYALLLSLVSTAFVLSLSLRKGFSVDVIKDRATLARELGNGAIENVYRLQIMNGTEHDQKYSVSVVGLPELQMLTPAEISVAPTGIGSLPLRLVLPAQQAQDYRGLASPITLKVSSTVAGKVQMLEEKSTFIVPR
jgi:cytochrome c oxidase accessory protein FixG